jgi:hypothetical protein
MKNFFPILHLGRNNYIVRDCVLQQKWLSTKVANRMTFVLARSPVLYSSYSQPAAILVKFIFRSLTLWNMTWSWKPRKKSWQPQSVTPNININSGQFSMFTKVLSAECCVSLSGIWMMKKHHWDFTVDLLENTDQYLIIGRDHRQMVLWTIKYATFSHTFRH